MEMDGIKKKREVKQEERQKQSNIYGTIIFKILKLPTKLLLPLLCIQLKNTRSDLETGAFVLMCVQFWEVTWFLYLYLTVATCLVSQPGIQIKAW